ncbi:hypothetical protein BpOF4_16805 [Alkalihalophilus pseudofirmus OF4]|uniref:DUF4386 domain-containing protein n=1 Tax=Alkalihalophilus pseudofirmus (strain ATCC BAA-2126 / JCM 17055 / OF4) TaxID=398511 RepID=D3FQN4_ALKPO|nr:hypothetical protein [Alkalihalophilus pseudofirmus]ADC51404.1 hypothetical protein BpOF4_16805 [Alkalihalophilus pseudofirmus OF4]
MRIIGWIGLFHVAGFVTWMVVNLIFQIQNPITIEQDSRLSISVLDYYSQFPGYFGFDHGSKAIILLISAVIPIGIYHLCSGTRSFQMNNLIAFICGSAGFILYALSFILQAAAVSYAIKLYSQAVDETTKQFAALLIEWSMMEGGLSTSIYILANFLIGIWIILHSQGIKNIGFSYRFRLFGYIVGGLLIVSYFIAWFFLMQGTQVMHDVTEVIGILFFVWLTILSISFVKGSSIIPKRVEE